MGIKRAGRVMVAVLVSTGALASGGLASATMAAAPGEAAHVASVCGVGSGLGYGYTYLTSLSVTHTSCATGRSVAKKHGHIRGWRCSTKRLATSPVQYQSRVTCTSGRRRVVWTYSQNT
jgi:hypothetical protein